MATPVVLPRQGQSVETCLILTWHKQVGDAVKTGDVVCEVETDKATFEVEAEADGTLLAQFFGEGDDVPVLTNIAAIGTAGENADEFRPAGSGGGAAPAAPAPAPAGSAPAAAASPAAAPVAAGNGSAAVSPRARALAVEKGVPAAALAGSGPGGRVIERDVQAYLASGAPLTAGALAAGGSVGMAGTGLGGRVTTADVAAAAGQSAAKPAAAAVAPAPATPLPDAVTEIAVKGIRKLISDRMLQSLQTSAQLTLNSSADARAVLAFRQKLKDSPEAMGLQKVSINDLILLVVARTLPDFPELNATFDGTTIRRFAASHVAFAVDTPRGLMVPVIRRAQDLSLKQLSAASKTLAKGCQEGGIHPDDLQGGTFTVSNLGALGISHFTPVLNLPQVAILGVGAAELKPVQGAAGVEFIPHLALSLTIDHRVVDGAPAAKFLAAVAEGLRNVELLLAV